MYKTFPEAQRTHDIEFIRGCSKLVTINCYNVTTLQRLFVVTILLQRLFVVTIMLQHLLVVTVLFQQLLQHLVVVTVLFQHNCCNRANRL